MVSFGYSAGGAWVRGMGLARGGAPMGSKLGWTILAWQYLRRGLKLLTLLLSRLVVHLVTGPYCSGQGLRQGFDP